MPENREAWTLWCKICTQWRYASYYKAGLDYNAVYAIAKTLCIDMTPGLLGKMQSLETQELLKQSKEIKNK